MHIESIGILANPRSDVALASVKAVCAAANNRNINCSIDASLASVSALKDIPQYNPSSSPDMIVALGGDGTILRAASYAARNGIPILGVNLGRIGFLSEIDVDGLSDALDAIAQDDYVTDDCMMLCCSVNGGQPFHCLNEAVLYRKDFSGVVVIALTINGESAGSVACDGLIVSTPTGATGYSISAGGPIIASGLNVAIITPICPHSLSFRPIIAAPDSVINLTMQEEGFLAMDGISTERIMPDDMIEIRRSDRCASFIRFKRHNIYSLIRSKLS